MSSAPSPAPSTTPVADDGGAAAVFRNRPFLLLWLSQLATQVGGNMVLFGLTIIASWSGVKASLVLKTVKKSAYSGFPDKNC